MRTLQQQIISPPILALSGPLSRYVVDSDACDKLLVLSYFKISHMDRQYQSDIGQGLSHKPSVRTMRPSLNVLPSIEHSCSDIPTCIYFNPPFVPTLPSLDGFDTFAGKTGKPKRRLLRLFKYEFAIAHRPGVNHQEAGALSRLKTERL